MSNAVRSISSTNDCIVEPAGMVAPASRFGKQKSQHKTGHESTSTLTRDIREDAACFRPPSDEKPNRHGGIYVRTRNVSNRVNHRQHDETKVSATPTCDTAPPVTLSITIAPVPANTRQNVPKNSATSFFPILCKSREDLGLQFQLAMLFAEVVNFCANFFQQFPRFRDLFRVRASKLRRVRK